MANPKSLMTDRSWQLVTAIRMTLAGHSSTAEIIEMALSAYLHQNIEYTATECDDIIAATNGEIDPAAPSTDLVGD